MPNRLANETSPYLLQHADNPVDWYPWGEEAFERAKCKDKPIFLSIGYSACHWCHVMAHESFEDPETAAIMNEHYICIKVDREERPDVDAIYMNAVQALTGSGGWPMSVWLLPDGRPFYGGTYFPNKPRHGMPSFKQVMLRMAELYREKRDEIEDQATRLTAAISGRVLLESEHNQPPSTGVLEMAYQHIAARYDRRWGGFGSQPKFPPSMTLELLLRMHHRWGWKQALDMVTHTLDRMMYGGIYDQIGGGFHRYSVDGMWLIPHFEKMLYDNALLLRIYLHGYQATRFNRYRRVVEEIAAYVQREMIAPDGGFASSQDADSEGEEGKFFIWEKDELREALGDAVNTDLLFEYWGVGERPNFEGKFVLWVPNSPELVAGRHGVTVEVLEAEIEKARQILFDVRERRVRPGRDDKVLTAWNGLMINSLAQAGRVLGRDDFTGMAADAANFVLNNLRTPDGYLLRSYKDGQAKIDAYLEDYAFLAEALLELYQTTFDLHWFEAARDIVERMVALFWDDEAGFFDTAEGQEMLITRPQELMDNAMPSGTSGAIAVLARIGLLAGESGWLERVDRVLERLGPAVQQYATAFSYLASQLDFVISQPKEIAIVGKRGSPDTEAMLDIVRKPYRPNQVVALREPDDERAAEVVPLLAGREQIDGVATAYVCRNFTCQLPVNTPSALRKQLSR
ncbi:MAG TPA: thioredoxin domain-containing protein [Aggregatilineales bacterium]|nr:thioredoxin domain-containing protein [Chloroflexota bacterium]HOA23371.1 thioredoxin domain-containing protein [Aggregatilineales bacterium]HQA69386.1 thioredoxin domain-containing protein [Aggregatilineales bacterium]HQE18506.1 thioredoxin domain-containing protein [Aggregatilineales bacterium]